MEQEVNTNRRCSPLFLFISPSVCKPSARSTASPKAVATSLLCTLEPRKNPIRAVSVSIRTNAYKVSYDQFSSLRLLKITINKNTRKYYFLGVIPVWKKIKAEKTEPKKHNKK